MTAKTIEHTIFGLAVLFLLSGVLYQRTQVVEVSEVKIQYSGQQFSNMNDVEAYILNEYNQEK